MRRLGLLLALTLGVARADGGPRPLVVLHPQLDASTAEAVRKEADRRGLEVATPAPPSEPASEELLADVRPLYQNMAFGAAVKKLEAAEASLLNGRSFTPAVARTLADVELWMGACLFLSHDHAGAEDRWALAQRLEPSVRLDPLFPPELQKAFGERRNPGRPLPVVVRLAPTGARLWLDGHLVDGPLSTVVGLHAAVAERADLLPAGQVVRIIRAAPQIALRLQTPADAATALHQIFTTLKQRPLSRDEALGVSGVLGRPLLLIGGDAHRLSATRHDAADRARPDGEWTAADAPALFSAMCATTDTCGPAQAPVLVAPVVAPPASPEKPQAPPVWRRGWFWGVVGASLAVAAGAALGIGFGMTAPRDYDLRVR
jgi:hypothetical protein